MYFCNNCQNRFEIPKVQKEWIGEKEHGGCQDFPVCPICGDDDIEKLHKCQLCDTYIFSKDDYCEPHKETVAEWMLDAYERIQATTDKDKPEILKAMSKWIENQ